LGLAGVARSDASRGAADLRGVVGSEDPHDGTAGPVADARVDRRHDRLPVLGPGGAGHGADDQRGWRIRDALVDQRSVLLAGESKAAEVEWWQPEKRRAGGKLDVTKSAGIRPRP